MKFRSLLLAATISLPCFLNAQTGPKETGLNTITPSAIQAQLEFLASDWTEGRETGTRGEYMASDYIASMFKTLGLKPGGDSRGGNRQRSASGRSGQVSASGSYFQNINFIETTPGKDQECFLVLKTKSSEQSISLDYQVDYSLNPGAVGFEFVAPVIFVGYGITDAGTGYDDYAGLDVKGKVILRLAGHPGWKDPDSPINQKLTANNNSIELYRSKDRIAGERGALAVIEISQNPDASFSPSNIPYRYNSATYEGDVPQNRGPRRSMALPGNLTVPIPRINFSERAQKTLVANLGINVADFENQIAASGMPPKKSKKPQEERVFLKINSSVESRIVQGRNVIAVLEGEDDNNRIVLGAHYDHMGKNNGFIFNGSDDDASGTVGIMSIARAMVATGVKPKNTIVFCAWTAEEKGLLGSRYFVSKADTAKICLYMNYDMISRTAPDDSTGMKADYNYSSGMPLLKELAEKHIKEYNLKLDMAYQTSPRPIGGSDFTSFSNAGIPIFLIHGKFTPDYHQFTDHADKAVLPYMTDIIRLGYLNIYELANKKW
jgi:hypothetical protein